MCMYSPQVHTSISLEDQKILSYITITGCSLSLCALVIAVLLFITNRYYSHLHHFPLSHLQYVESVSVSLVSAPFNFYLFAGLLLFINLKGNAVILSYIPSLSFFILFLSSSNSLFFHLISLQT